MVSRRIAALLGAAVTLAGLLVTPPALACACGGVASPAGFDVSVAQEQAIVSRHNGQETIELRLGLESASVGTGLVFPTPEPAEVSLGSAATFEQIETATAPRTVVEKYWFGLPETPTGSGPGAAAAAAPFRPQILSQVQLGPLQATTLRAQDATGLTEWLAGNNYRISDAVTALLPDYIDRGWYFVAVKLTGETALSGNIDPIQITFPSEALVYPMTLSRAATTAQFVRLYVFDEHRARPAALAAPSAELRVVTSTYWAGQAPSELVERGPYLTALNLEFPNPATDIPGDLTMVRAPDDSAVQLEIRVKHLVTLAGIPIGWAVPLAVVLLWIVIGTIRGIVRRRRRDNESTIRLLRETRGLPRFGIRLRLMGLLRTHAVDRRRSYPRLGRSTCRSAGSEARVTVRGSAVWTPTSRHLPSRNGSPFAATSLDTRCRHAHIRVLGHVPASRATEGANASRYSGRTAI